MDLHAQDVEIEGQVLNAWNIPINGVQILNERTSGTNISDCDGKFRIHTKIGDSLRITAPYLVPKHVVISNGSFLTIGMDLDKNKTQSIFDSILSQRYDNPDVERKKILLKGRSEVTMFVDYAFEKGIPRNLKDLEPNDIDTILSLKPAQAQSILGDWGKSGAIWIITRCSRE